MVNNRFRRFSNIVLVATLGVILFGAYVRASGSGAGCGSHWPTCNGEVIPRPRSVATVIEFTHRATTGLISVLVAWQLIWALKLFPRGHRVRKVAVCSAVFLVSEALVGAGLVLFELVARDTSAARAAWIGAHMLNTFLLLASLTLTGFWAREPLTTARPMRGHRAAAAPIVVGLFVLAAVGATGAVTALGDTLFPARSLADGVAVEFTGTAHLFERLRVVHPVLAVLGAAYLLAVSAHARARTAALRSHAGMVSALIYLQLAVGVINLWLLAPLATQLVHLLVADLLFIAVVRLGAASLEAPVGAGPAALESMPSVTAPPPEPLDRHGFQRIP